MRAALNRNRGQTVKMLLEKGGHTSHINAEEFLSAWQAASNERMMRVLQDHDPTICLGRGLVRVEATSALDVSMYSGLQK